MTSEIRTNSLKSRAGMSTVTMTDTGPMFSGITTFVDNSTFSVGTGGTIHAPATNTLNIGVNNTESIRIDSNSNLKVAGIVTATHFYGNGANLSGLPAGTTINSNTNNYLITGTGTANTLQGEANLTFDGQALTIGSGYLAVRQGSLPQVDIQNSTDTSYARLYIAQSSGSGGYFAINKIGTNGGGYTGGSNAAQLWLSSNAPMLFATNNAERLRIEPSGKLIVKTAGMNLENASATNSRGYSITNAAGTTGWTLGNGIIASAHQFVIYDNTAGAARLKIDSTGKIGINNNNPTAKLHVNAAYSETGAIISGGASGYNNTLEVQNANGTRLMTVKGDGIIGVNNTAPEGKGIDVTHSRTNTYSTTGDNRNLAHIIARNSSDASGRFASISMISGGGTQAEGSLNLVQTGNYTGDLAFKMRTSVSNWAERLRIASSGDISADAGYGSLRSIYPCRAWANLSGDSNPATIRVSRGLSGVTDLGTGDYRFTFSSAMTDANYSALCSSAGDGGWSMVPHIYSHSDMTTTTVRFSINAVNMSGQNYDRDIFCMAIFR